MCCIQHTQADHRRPHFHSGEPTGKTIKIAGRYETYVAEPKGKKHDGVALLYIQDIFGIWQNSKLMADQFAENGYHTIIVDVFNGDVFPNPPPQDIMKWLAEGTDGNNPHTKEAVDLIVEEGLKHLKEQGFTKIGAVGYCFGAKVCRTGFIFAHRSTPLLAAY